MIEQALAINDQPVVIDFLVHDPEGVSRWSRPAPATTTSSSRADIAPDWEAMEE